MSELKLPNSTIFIDLFTEIEQELRKHLDEHYYAGFLEMIRKMRQTNSVVKMFYSDLQEFAQLRNAIVHTRRENFVIAEPHDDVVTQIRHIRNLLMNPPKLSLVMTKQPYTSHPGDSLQMILTVFAEKDIMRCPIIDNGTIIGMITAKTIAKWMISKKQAFLNIESARVADFLPFINEEDFIVVSENMDIFTLAGTFRNSITRGIYIQAALVTLNGKRNSPLTGIITPADVPYLMNKKNEFSK